MNTIFKKYLDFCIVYIDDILVFCNSEKEHRNHLKIIFNEFINQGLIISSKKLQLEKTEIEFLGLYIKGGNIELQKYIVTKVFEFSDKIEKTKQLQSFFELLNYCRNFIPNLSKLVGPLYNKLGKNGQKYFNLEYIELVRKIKSIVKKLEPLNLPLENNYKIIQTDTWA